MTAIRDPELNFQAQYGELVSQMNQLMDKGKVMFSQLEAKLILATRSEPRLLKRGMIEVHELQDSFTATFTDNPPQAEVNGQPIPARPNRYIRATGKDQYQALAKLAVEIKKESVLG